MTKTLQWFSAALLIVTAGVAGATVLTNSQLGFVGNNSLDTLHAQCTRISILPPAVPIFPGVEPDATPRIVAAGTRALKAAGFEVLGSEAYGSAYDKVVREAGGLYNPGTGVKRSDVMGKAVDAAIKALLSDPQVTCFASLHVERAKAKMFSRLAVIDGAIERSDGGANSAISSFFQGLAGQGTLPAIVVVLRIFDRNEKLLYIRDGGVQLTTYLDHQHHDNYGDYLVVPPASLLQDEKRIDRALLNATVPMKYTPAQIDAGSDNPAINMGKISYDDLPQPPAAMHRVDKPLLVPREQILGSVHRVVLGPLTANGLAIPPEVAARYRSLVHERLVKLGWEVIDSDQLLQAMGYGVQQAGGIYDRITGNVDPAQLQKVMQVTLNSLALPAPVDAVALLSVIRTSATQNYGNVYWDGTFLSALTMGPADNHFSGFGNGTADLHAGEGGINAMSFSFVLRDAKGSLLVDSHGGIELLQKLTLQGKHSGSTTTYEQTYTNLTPADLFKNPARDVHAVDAALAELLHPAGSDASSK